MRSGARRSSRSCPRSRHLWWRTLRDAPRFARMAGESPKLAPNLQVATNKDMVHVDGAGRVRSPSRYRAIHTAYYGLIGALALLEVALVYVLFKDDGALGATMGAFV